MTTTVLAYIPSPAQGVWHIFGVPLRAYALFIIVGIVAALVIGDRRWVARGGEPGVVYDVALWAVPFGLFGGRLYHVITDWRTYFGDEGAGFVAALRIWEGGLGIWGAVALGGLGAWIACRRRGIPLPAFGDAVAPGIILAQAIGRLGNYFNQELFGRPTDLPWGLEIYERRNAAGVLDSLNGVSTGRLVEVVHPTFLYELLWNLLIFAALIVIDRRFKVGHGRLFAMYVAGYCVGRFWIELMRSDAATLLAGIRVNSFTSTFVFIGAVVYIMAAPKGREDPATLRGDAEIDDDSEVEDFVKELVLAGSTTGVVAAAKVADEDDEQWVAEAAEAEADSVAEGIEADVADEDSDQSVTEADEAGGLGSVEGDEVPDADDADAPTDEAEVFETEPTAAVGGVGSVEGDDEGVTEALAADVDAEIEDIEAPSDEAVGEERADEPVVEPAESVEPVTEADEAGGVGSVEGDEVAEVADEASVVAHEVAVDGEAEALVADVEAEDTEAEVDAEPVTDTAETEAGGLGSVEGAEVVVAAEDAAVVHEAAVEGKADAEELAAEVDAESQASSDAAIDEEPADEPIDEPAESVEAEESDESVTEADEAGGVGSVEGDEVAEVADEASVVAHEVAVDGEAEALVADVDAESDESDAEDESVTEVDEAEAEVSGLGSVEGAEVVVAAEDAAVVHEATVEGEADAEELAEVEADSEASSDAAIDERAGEPVVEPAEPVEAEESVESVTEADEAEAGGLGSVEGDEVADAAEDATQVHELAVEGEGEAKALAAEVEAEESGTDEVEPEADGDGADTAEAALESDGVAVEGDAVADVLTADVEIDDDRAVYQTSYTGSDSGRGGRVRRWLRRRRNR